jgi:hypothetical protein
MKRECRTPQEFSRIMWEIIKPYGWSWKKDVRPWLASVFGGAKFGDPTFDWSPSAARSLAREFLSEASTW